MLAKLGTAIVVLGTGCTLYEGGSNGDVTGGGPIGRAFLVERTVETASSCPMFVELELAHTVEVEDTAIFVDGALAAGPVIRSGPAREVDGDAPNLAFTIFESWSSPDGPASPLVHYDLWVDGGLVTGRADTSFAPSCMYTWTVVGL